MSFDKKLQDLRARKAAAKAQKGNAVSDLRDALADSSAFNEMGFTAEIEDGRLILSQGLYDIYIEWDGKQFVIDNQSHGDIGVLVGETKFAATLDGALGVVAELVDENED